MYRLIIIQGFGFERGQVNIWVKMGTSIEKSRNFGIITRLECRGSSVVERSPEEAGVECSIHSRGTDIMDGKSLTMKAYNETAPLYGKTHFKHFWVEEFKLFKNMVPGKKVIDIGCGAGRDAAVFVKNKFDYLGVDNSKGMLEIAKKRVKKGKFRQMDYYNLRFPANTFDGTWAAASLLHVPKKKIRNVLRKIKKITKPGGVNFISLKEKVNFEEGIVPYPLNPGTFRYWSFYTKEEFKKILEEVGFKSVKALKHKEKNKDGSTTVWLYFLSRK
jgi:ubiquinone/menaquinone biosynthesis C-methylase UbiE